MSLATNGAGDVGAEPSISVVITNFNTAALTARCLDGVTRYKGPRAIDAVVVDDASSEPVRPQLPPLPPWVEVFENPTNVGYVRSVNLGVARTHGDVVLLLDSDAAPLMDVFTPAARAFGANPRLGALGFQLVDTAGNPTGATAREPTALGLAVGQALEQRLAQLLGRLSNGFTIHSCAIAFRRAAFDQLGGFDETFDFLDADTDFSMRLRRTGWELRVDRETRILHEGSGSPQSTARRVLRHHANRWRLLEKHGLLPHPTLIRSVLAARHAAELLWLSGPSRLLQRDARVRADKLEGRRQLMATVWRSYRA